MLLGAQKAGTSWLVRMLQQHSDVFIPQKKELHFFNNRGGFFDRGVSAYAEHFAGARADQLCGESTPEYLYLDEARKRICELLPEVRLIYRARRLLRDDVAYNLRRLTGGSPSIPSTS